MGESHFHWWNYLLCTKVFSHLKKKTLEYFTILKNNNLYVHVSFFFVLNFSMKHFFLIILFVKVLLLQCFHIDNQSYLSVFQYFKTWLMGSIKWRFDISGGITPRMCLPQFFAQTRNFHKNTHTLNIYTSQHIENIMNCKRKSHDGITCDSIEWDYIIIIKVAFFVLCFFS